MISALHLIWIIPLSTCFGFAICAILTVGKDSENNAAESKGETKWTWNTKKG